MPSRAHCILPGSGEFMCCWWNLVDFWIELGHSGDQNDEILYFGGFFFQSMLQKSSRKETGETGRNV